MNFDINENDALNTMAKQAVKQAVKAEKDRTERLTKDDKDAFLKQFKEFWDFERDFHPEYKKLWGDKTEFDKADTKIINLIIGNAARDLGLDWDWIGDETYLFGFYEKDGSPKNMAVKVPYDFTFPSLRTKLLNWFRKKCENALAAEPKKPQIKVTEAFRAGNRARKKESSQDKDTAGQDMTAWPSLPVFMSGDDRQEMKKEIVRYRNESLTPLFSNVRNDESSTTGGFSWGDKVMLWTKFEKPGRTDAYKIGIFYKDNGTYMRPYILFKLNAEDDGLPVAWSAPESASPEEASRMCADILFSLAGATGRVILASNILREEDRKWRLEYQKELDNTFRHKYYSRFGHGASNIIRPAKFIIAMETSAVIACLDSILPFDCVLRLDVMGDDAVNNFDDRLTDMIKSAYLPQEFINEAFRTGNTARKKESVQDTAGVTEGLPPVSDEIIAGDADEIKAWFEKACPNAAYVKAEKLTGIWVDISMFRKRDDRNWILSLDIVKVYPSNDRFHVRKVMLRTDNGHKPHRGAAFLIEPEGSSGKYRTYEFDEAFRIAVEAWHVLSNADLPGRSYDLWERLRGLGAGQISEIKKTASEHGLVAKKMPKPFIPWTFAMEELLGKTLEGRFDVRVTPEMTGRLFDRAAWNINVPDAWADIREEIRRIIGGYVTEAFRAGNRARKKEAMQDTADNTDIPMIVPGDDESCEKAADRLDDLFPKIAGSIAGGCKVKPFRWDYGMSFTMANDDIVFSNGRSYGNSIFVKYIFDPSDHDKFVYADMSLLLGCNHVMSVAIELPVGDCNRMNLAMYDLLRMLTPYLNPEYSKIKELLTLEARKFCDAAGNEMDADGDFWKKYNRSCSNRTAVRTALLVDFLNSELPESVREFANLNPGYRARFNMRDIEFCIVGIAGGFREGLSPEEAVKRVKDSLTTPLHEAFRAGNRARKKEAAADAVESVGERIPEVPNTVIPDKEDIHISYTYMLRNYVQDFMEWVNDTFGDRLKASPRYPGTDLPEAIVWNGGTRIYFRAADFGDAMIITDIRLEHNFMDRSGLFRWNTFNVFLNPVDGDRRNPRKLLSDIVKICYTASDPDFNRGIDAIPDFLADTPGLSVKVIRTVEGCSPQNKCSVKPEELGDLKTGRVILAAGPVLETILSDITPGYSVTIEHHWKASGFYNAVRDLMRNTPGFPIYGQRLEEAFKAGNNARKHEKAEDAVEKMITPEMYYPPVETYNPVTVVMNLQHSLMQFTDGEVEISVEDERWCKAWIPYTDGFTKIEISFINEPENSGSPWCCRIRIRPTERLGYRGTVTFINDRLWDSCDSGDVPEDAGRICGDFLIYLLSKKDFTLTLIQNAINYLLNNHILDCPDPFIMATVMAGWERIIPPGWRIENLNYLISYNYADRCRALAGEETGVNEAWRAQKKAIKELPRDYIDEARTKQNLNAAVDRLAEDLWKDVTIELDTPENDGNPDPEAEPVTIVKRKVDIPELFERIKDGLNEFGDFDVDPELRPDVVGEYAVITTGGMPYAQVGGSCGIPAHVLGQYEATSLVIFKDLVYEFARTLTDGDPGKMQEFIKALNVKADDLFW